MLINLKWNPQVLQTYRLFPTCLIFLFLLGGTCQLAADTNPTAGQIEAQLANTHLRLGQVNFEITPLLRDIYRHLDYAPLWGDPENVVELLELINNAEDHGLIPGDYYAATVEDIFRESGGSNNAQSDILLTESLLLYGSHRRYGKVRASDLDNAINYRRDPISSDDPEKVIKLALSGRFLQTFMEMAAPSGPAYRRMQVILDEYRDTAANGGWPSIDDGPTLRLGDQGPRVQQMRRFLFATHDLTSDRAEQDDKFDESLELAVKAFQNRHALDADGIAGRNTFAAMAVPIERRIDQLRLTLERLRWVNQEAVDTFIAVNIAGYRIFFIKGGELTWETRAMVGKHYRQTPMFRGDVAYMEFNPTWTIPPGIMRHDTLPAIKKDPNYLASKHIRVLEHDGREVDPATVDWNQYTRGVPYVLRQDPGPWNSLGTVKFIFPNSHFVFLHDTPHPELFDHAQRAFSSGCIRVEDPLGLAQLLLSDQNPKSRDELQSIVDSRETQRIHLNPKIPVILTYLTASLNDADRPLFYPDIYDRDDAVLKALNGKAEIQTAGR